jgi:hypothetical protein
LGSTKTFKISNIAEDIPEIDNFPSPPDLIVLPKKNGGSTYVYDLDPVSFSEPDLFEISPVIDGKQCGISSSLTDIPDCDTLL